MIHSLQDGGKQYCWFTVLSTKMGTPESSAKDSDYVKEHPALKYLRKKIAQYLHDFHGHRFAGFGLPPSNAEHSQLSGSDLRRPMRRVQPHTGPRGGGSGRNRNVLVYAMRNSKNQLFKYGECYKDGHPGSGSTGQLYYINLWAMCWPSDHPKRTLTG